MVMSKASSWEAVAALWAVTDEGRHRLIYGNSVGADAHCQDLIVYKMFGRIVYTPRACKFSSNRIVLSPD